LVDKIAEFEKIEPDAVWKKINFSIDFVAAGGEKSCQYRRKGKKGNSPYQPWRGLSCIGGGKKGRSFK